MCGMFFGTWHKRRNERRLCNTEPREMQPTEGNLARRLGVLPSIYTV